MGQQAGHLGTMGQSSLTTVNQTCKEAHLKLSGPFEHLGQMQSKLSQLPPLSEATILSSHFDLRERSPILNLHEHQIVIQALSLPSTFVVSTKLVKSSASYYHPVRVRARHLEVSVRHFNPVMVIQNMVI